MILLTHDWEDKEIHAFPKSECNTATGVRTRLLRYRTLATTLQGILFKFRQAYPNEVEIIDIYLTYLKEV